MVGCCSIPLTDGGRGRQSLWRRLSRTHMVEPELRVTAAAAVSGALARQFPRGLEAPALLKGYLRLGARVLGPAGWDPDFGCADLPLLLRFDDIAPRYGRRLLQSLW